MGRGLSQTIRAIYSVQLHSHSGEAPEAVGAVIEALRATSGGIVQADGQGFSNEAGDCVVWQFSDNAIGPWTMAVLDEAGNWLTFDMQLGNRAHCSAFLAGKVPQGVVAR